MTPKQIIVNNLLISYYFTEAEKPLEGAPILLFLHGWRSESVVWTNVMTRMSEQGYNCIAMDLPGFGRTEEPKTPFLTNDYAKTVTDFIKKLGIIDVIGIGHSYGGRVLMNISINHTYKFKKIVLVDSSGIDNDTGKVSLFKTIAKFAKPFFKPKFMQPLRAKIYKKIGADDYIAAETSAFFKQTYLNITKDDYTLELRKITTPTFIIWGADDRDTPVELAGIIYDSVKDSDLEVIEKAGHYVFLDQPAQFLAKLSEFVRR
jgi:pimeloyl-ACP methyl ester carboxylesterase